MRMVPLGRTGIDVSEIILGCGTIGGFGGGPAIAGEGLSDGEALLVLEAGAELGINVVDTADSYAGGHSEEVIGSWLANGHDDVLVATKVGFRDESNQDETGRPQFCLTPEHILRQLPTSLDRLGRPCADLYLSHAPDAATPIAETLETFASLLGAGTVRAIGACNVSAAQLTEALEEAARLGLPRYEWVQNGYSLLARGDEEDVLPICREHGLGYTPHSVLCGGVLSGKVTPDAAPPAGSRVALRSRQYAPYLTDDVLGGVQQLGSEAKRLGVGTAALALAWVASNPDVTAALVGASRPEQFVDVRDALELRLDLDQREKLARLFR